MGNKKNQTYKSRWTKWRVAGHAAGKTDAQINQDMSDWFAKQTAMSDINKEVSARREEAKKKYAPKVERDEEGNYIQQSYVIPKKDINITEGNNDSLIYSAFYRFLDINNINPEATPFIDRKFVDFAIKCGISEEIAGSTKPSVLMWREEHNMVKFWLELVRLARFDKEDKSYERDLNNQIDAQIPRFEDDDLLFTDADWNDDFYDDDMYESASDSDNIKDELMSTIMKDLAKVIADKLNETV